VQAAIAVRGADSPFAAQAVQKAEAEWAAAVAEIGKAQVAETGATIRAEAASGDALQRWWRPLYALELSVCPAFALTLLHTLWTGHAAGISGFATLSGLLITYFAARFGMLGVYVTGRTREKQAAATETAMPGLIREVVKAVRGVITGTSHPPSSPRPPTSPFRSGCGTSGC
jgi:hypothetical protein